MAFCLRLRPLRWRLLARGVVGELAGDEAGRMRWCSSAPRRPLEVGVEQDHLKKIVTIFLRFIDYYSVTIKYINYIIIESKKDESPWHLNRSW